MKGAVQGAIDHLVEAGATAQDISIPLHAYGKSTLHYSFTMAAFTDRCVGVLRTGPHTHRSTNVWRCGGLTLALLQLKDPLELCVKRREYI